MSARLSGNHRISRRRRFPGRAFRDTLTAYAFLGPSALLIAVFGVFPVIFTVFVSLFRWRLARGRFSGLENYVTLFGGNPAYLAALAGSLAALVLAAALLRTGRQDDRRGAAYGGAALLAGSLVGIAVFLPYLAARGDSEVFDALRVTIWYCLCTVPPQMAAGLLLAVLITRTRRGKQAFRVIYLLPYIAPTVATAAIFELLFSLRPDSFANQVVGLLGAAPLQWLQEPRGIIALALGRGLAESSGGVVGAYWGEWAQGPSLALASIVLYSWWVFVGYYALVYMTGLGAIPRQIHEAAEVDGAGAVRRFFSITLPLLSPTTYFLSLLGVIGTFKAFTHLYVLRSPSASGTVDPISVMIFFTAFRKGNLGYASAVGVFLFLIVLGLTLAQQRATARNISYGD
ncbi:MAG: carbohydrate ABC transporter permease [Spirochaetia bacterium]